MLFSFSVLFSVLVLGTVALWWMLNWNVSYYFIVIFLLTLFSIHLLTLVDSNYFECKSFGWRKSYRICILTDLILKFHSPSPFSVSYCAKLENLIKCEKHEYCIVYMQAYVAGPEVMK